ncbi:MAG: DUF59 domain-containing protein [Calditrichaceae bacterium]
MSQSTTMFGTGDIISVLKSVFDPEIPVNIYELGLIYDIKIEESAVKIQMTLTSPNCPAAQSLPVEIKNKVAELSGVSEVMVEIVWEPGWGPEMMSDAAKLQLGFL